MFGDKHPDVAKDYYNLGAAWNDLGENQKAIECIQKALEIAFECHKGQKRKGNNSPYIVHILDVAKLLLSEPSATENINIAGILHDALEDTNYNSDQLKFNIEYILKNFFNESTTDVTSKNNNNLIKSYKLEQNYPNPFYTKTKINYISPWL